MKSIARAEAANTTNDTIFLNIKDAATEPSALLNLCPVAADRLAL